jgi:uncharacterized protein (TIGR03066 family)
MVERLGAAAAACVAALVVSYCVADLFVKGTARSPSAASAGGATEQRAETAVVDKADKLVGVWEVVKSEEAPPGATIEFTRDGKMKMTVNAQGKEMTLEGTYKVDGDKITSIQTFGGKEQRETATIQTLDDTTLITRDEKGKVDEFKRKK